MSPELSPVPGKPASDRKRTEKGVSLVLVQVILEKAPPQKEHLAPERRQRRPQRNKGHHCGGKKPSVTRVLRAVPGGAFAQSALLHSFPTFHRHLRLSREASSSGHPMQPITSRITIPPHDTRQRGAFTHFPLRIPERTGMEHRHAFLGNRHFRLSVSREDGGTSSPGSQERI
jgi:hypothetical protein